MRSASMLLQTAGPVSAAPGTSGKRRVILLSGFLGSGKTTLLRAELARAGESRPAVILNEFGQTMVDDALLTDGQRPPVALSGGCACCTRRTDLALALSDLLDDEQRGLASRRDHVVIETSGLSDPGPIAFTLANDPVLKHHYALTRICVTVDALLGLDSLERHEVALRQLLAADELLVTKADLIEPAHIEVLIARLHELNPSAAIMVTANGVLLRVEDPPSTTARAPAVSFADSTHASVVSTLELVTDEALDWQAFAVWLSLLLHTHGPEILRVKGVLDVQDVGPVAINGVQHVVHRPEYLTGHGPSDTRLVLIVRDIDTNLIKRSFRTFLSID